MRKQFIENHQKTNKKLYCEDVLQMLSLKGNIWLLEMTIGRLMIALLPGHGAAGHGESVQKAQTSDDFVPLLNGDGGGRGGRGLSVHRRGSKCRRQTVQVPSVLGNVSPVHCAMQWEVPYSQEL